MEIKKVVNVLSYACKAMSFELGDAKMKCTDNEVFNLFIDFMNHANRSTNV